MQLKPYEHTVHYYETDQMGITHHSNYIRWFEEARVDYMNQMGLGYKQMEECGIISPVIGITCDYKSMTHFEDTVLITVFVKKYNGIRLTIGYEIREKSTNTLCCTGESRHCFLSKENKPLSLSKTHEGFDKMFRDALIS